MNDKIKEFYTIEIKLFDFNKQKAVDKKIKLYNGDYFPPTIYSVLGKNRKAIPIGNLGLKLNDISEDIKQRFEKNINIQNNIVSIIKNRNEKQGYQCGIIKLETGVGKGNLATQIVNYYQHKTLILVSNKKLQAEMIERFEEFTNIKPSQYGGGKKDISDITICTKQSFIKDYDLFKSFKLVVIDEMHQGFTDKMILSLNKCFHKQKIALYGMSGTPYTQDLETDKLEKYFGKKIDLNIGYDIIPSFTFFNYYNSKEYEWDHYSKLKQELIDDQERYKNQKKQLNKILIENSYCLVLSDRIDEIERLYNDYLEKNIELVKITGETKIEDDELNLKKALESNKKILIVGSISKVGTGFNFPILDSIFLIASIKFEAQVIQAVGRILRKHNKKTNVNAYIWNDNILKKQITEKRKTIISEYGLTKEDIKEIDINKREAVLGELHMF